MTILLSLVVPAYNESRRLPPYLESIRDHMAQQFGDAYEVLVVDDGSSDALPHVLQDECAQWPQLEVLRHDVNQGKGAAVRTGMLAARGDLLLFADADGATPICEENRLRAAINAGADLAVASRLVRSRDVQRRRNWFRGLIGRLFAGAARLAVRLPVLDTQCGFKMFRREVGQQLFEQVTERGYLFDIEILLLAVRHGYRVAEVPVNWADRPGSRLNMAGELWRILRGLWRLRRRRITLDTNHRQTDNAVSEET
jgi:dolichyl-phosphate beta-glucosyltransferase